MHHQLAGPCATTGCGGSTSFRRRHPIPRHCGVTLPMPPVEAVKGRKRTKQPQKQPLPLLQASISRQDPPHRVHNRHHACHGCRRRLRDTPRKQRRRLFRANNDGQLYHNQQQPVARINHPQAEKISSQNYPRASSNHQQPTAVVYKPARHGRHNGMELQPKPVIQCSSSMMDSRRFYGIRVPPVEDSEDSCLSDSDSDYSPDTEDAAPADHSGQSGSDTGNIRPVPGIPDLGACSNVVLELSRSIPENKNYLFFDNWFTSIKLLVSLHQRVIPALGTARANRISGCRLPSDAEMKKDGRGSHMEREATVDGVEVRVVKWYDSRGVNIASTFGSGEPLGSCQQFDRKKKAPGLDDDDSSSSSDSEEETEEVSASLPPELAELFQSASEDEDFEGFEE
ncbi:hypothetical protein HPB51_001568 [Rhipicephalus microplus]|uniref:PiggyBac transposable element-derived protein domain-containing protein n=1 Tax=Rhipicephalus microplus TaxID=6941 RepID=A0A9J6EWD9_RHIMP|nr:hypothetical protein HPB51_001568 [Rhipicephalus microplus]